MKDYLADPKVGEKNSPTHNRYVRILPVAVEKTRLQAKLYYKEIPPKGDEMVSGRRL